MDILIAMRGIIGGTCAGLLLAAFCFAGHWQTLDALSGPLHVTALPMFAGVCMAVVAGGAAFAALRSPNRTPGTWVFTGISGATAAALIASQLVTGPGWHASDGEVAAAPSATRVRVVQANMLIGNTNYDEIMRRAAHAQVVALAEADPALVAKTLAKHALAQRFLTVRASTARTQSGVTSTTVLLVSRHLAPKPLPASDVPFAAAGVMSELGRIVAVHTASPSARRVWQGAWRTTVAASAGQCVAGGAGESGTGGTLVAGDFNAVWAQLRPYTQCADAATTLHRSAAGSWRTGWPAWLGTRIDHQLYDPDAYTPTSFELFRIPGSDHRGTDVTYVHGGVAHEKGTPHT